MRRYNKRKKSQHQKKFIFYHRSNALSLFTQKERMKKKTHEMRVIDTHPIKIKYQNYTHTGFCCCGIWLPWVFLLSMMTEKIARFFVTRGKPFCNLISGNKLKNQIQTNFIDRKKTTTRKSGRYPFFHEFFFSVVNQKDISHKVNQKKKKIQRAYDWYKKINEFSISDLLGANMKREEEEEENCYIQSYKSGSWINIKTVWLSYHRCFDW